MSENVETAARLHLVSFFFQRSSKLQLQRFRSGCFCHVFFELQILRADIFILGGGGRLVVRVDIVFHSFGT